jgi:hypothetical protein
VRTLYLDGLVQHLPALGELDRRGIEPRSLEKQMREWDPEAPRRPRADDRIDALVHALTWLAPIAGKGEIDMGPPRDDDLWAEGFGSRYDDADGGQRDYDGGR